MRTNLPILVLETDAPLERLLEAVLKRDGYSPRFVRDGKTALQLLNNEIGALIVDVSIAPSTLERGARRGIGLIHYIQRNRPALFRRTLVITALRNRELPLDLPDLRILQKPFDVDALRNAIAEVTTGQGTGPLR